MADNNNQLRTNDEMGQEPINTKQKNKLKEAANKIKQQLKAFGKLVLAKFKWIALTIAAIAIGFILLSVAYYYLLLDESEQKEFDKKNLPGQTAMVMNARAKRGENGEIIFIDPDEDIGDHIIKTDEPGADEEVDEDEFIDIISQLTIVGPQGRQNIIDNADAFIQAQEDFQVNALFLAAIT